MTKPEIEGQQSLSQSGETFYSPETADQLMLGFISILNDPNRAPLTEAEQKQALLSGRNFQFQPVSAKDMLQTAIEKSLRDTDLSNLSSEEVKRIKQQTRYAILNGKKDETGHIIKPGKLDELKKARDLEGRRLVPFALIRSENNETEVHQDYVKMFISDLQNQQGLYESWELFKGIVRDETPDEKRWQEISKFMSDAVASKDISHMSKLIGLADATFSKRYYWFDHQLEDYIKASAELRDQFDLED